MDTILGTAQHGADQLRIIVEWVSGLTGLSSLVVVWLMIKAGSAVIRTLARVVLVVAVIACAVWAYLHFGLDAYVDVLSILGLG